MTLSQVAFTAAALFVGCRTGGEPTVSFAGADVSVYNAFAPASGAPGLGSLYFSVVNQTSVDDSLIAVTLDAGRSELHRVQAGMHPVTSIPVRAGGHVDLQPGGYHIMLLDLPGLLQVGDTLRATLHFSNGTSAAIDAPVLTYTEVVRNLERGIP